MARPGVSRHPPHSAVKLARRALFAAIVLWTFGFSVALMLRSYHGVDLTIAILSGIAGKHASKAILAAPLAVALCVSVRRLIQRSYVSALVWAMPALIGALAIQYGTRIGELARFRGNRSTYDRIIEGAKAGDCSTLGKKLPGQAIVDYVHCRPPVVVIFAWTWFSAGWRGVIYDESDEIARPVAERSAGQTDERTRLLLSCSQASRNLGDHYYLAAGWYATTANHCGRQSLPK